MHGIRNSIIIVRESSLWMLIRDSFCPLDVLRFRTAGRRWNNCGMVWRICCSLVLLHDRERKKRISPFPEWPSIRFDNFVFASKAMESRESSDFRISAAQGKEHDQELVVRSRKSTHHHMLSHICHAVWAEKGSARY